MTSDERDELMLFLRELSIVREPVDSAARALILQSIAQNPDVAYRLVQQLMGLRLAMRAQANQPAAKPTPAQPEPAGAWSSGLLKTALAAGLGAAAGAVLADQASSWLSSDDLDLGD